MPKKVDESTVIQFNLKWFISIIVAIVSFFVTFYFTVQKPNNDEVKDHMTELMTREREYQDLKFQKLDDLNQTVTDLQDIVDALKKRNDDLIDLREELAIRDIETGASL